MTEIIQLDQDILLFVNSLHCTFFDYFMKACSDKYVWIPFYLALFLLVIHTFGLKKAGLVLLFIGLTILLTDQITASLIRPMVCRLRPANPDNPLSAVVHIVDGYRGGSYGFPSSHAANTAGLAFFVIHLFRRKPMTWLMTGWMVLVCYSRMYLGVHFLGDILVGIVIGALIGILMSRLCEKLQVTSGNWQVTSEELQTKSGKLQTSNDGQQLKSQISIFNIQLYIVFFLTILAMLIYACVRL